MKNENNNIPIGLLKTLIVCIYDFLLLFSILFFLSFPFVIYFDNQSFGDNIFYRIYLGIIIISYYTYFWKTQGQTLGMKSWKVYLINNNDGEITVGQCITRIIFALFGGHITMLIGYQSVHSYLSKTSICNKI
tara:strand:+ start:918 stop:1316 length:399 start_codon:yes stop_codon:yes gene_type:complete